MNPSAVLESNWWSFVTQTLPVESLELFRFLKCFLMFLMLIKAAFIWYKKYNSNSNIVKIFKM